LNSLKYYKNYKLFQIKIFEKKIMNITGYTLI